MGERERIAEIEDLTVKEFKEEILYCIGSLKKGVKPGNAMEVLATTLNINLLGEDLKLALERWMQLDLWETVDNK